MLSILLILISLPLPIILLLLYNKKHNDLRRPPGPAGLPFIGNLHQFDGKFPHKYLHALSKKHGPILSLKLGFRQVVVVSSSDLVRDMMKSDLVFSGRPRLTSLQRLSYNGLDIAFSPYNHTWREMRKLAALHLFSAKNFRPICRDEISRMIREITRDASLSRATNLSETMVSFANNTICRVAFGKSYGGEGYGKKNRFYDILHETQAVMGGFYVKDYFPLLGWIDEVSGMNAKLEKNFRELDSFYEELIDEHLNSERPKSMEGDVIDLLLGLQRDGDGSSSSFHLTLEHIKALLMNIITGGTDTVTATIVWAMTALIKNPSIMNKVQKEIRQKLGENNDFINEEDTSKLPYLKAVIKETLRLHLPAPLLVPRETIQKCSIGDYEIEAGTMVYLNAWAIGRDPETWENPNEFLPERFLETEVDVRGRDPEVIPFGIGRRGCPGIAIGMYEVETVLANVLYRFDWGVEDVDFDVLPGMTMHKKNALCLVPKLVVE